MLEFVCMNQRMARLGRILLVTLYSKIVTQFATIYADLFAWCL